MSKLLTNQIANYDDNGPVEAKEGLNFPTGKPLQVAGSPGASGAYLKSDGTGLVWEPFPTIPAAQVQVDWTATTGVTSILNKPTLAAVATSGSYTDLINQPTIPAAQVNPDWNATSGLGQILNKPALFSGNYSDLNGRPTIPATITDLADVDLPLPIPNDTYIRWNSSTSRWEAGSGASGLANIVEDTTPQLGGNLDLNGNTINGAGTLEVTGSSNKIKFLYDQLTDLPSATDWHGMFAHVHAEGAAYFAHAGQWIKLANDSQIVPDTNTTYSQQAVGTTGGVNLRLTSSGGLNDDITITAGLNISIDNIGSNGFRINSTASGGGGATVTTDDSAPTSPQDGDLWWKSDEGRLKVYYSDPNSSQWVDASPPLANTTIASGNSTVLVVNTNGATEDAIEFWGGNAKKWRMTQGGDLLPTADGLYDIGSSSYKVKDLYLDATSLHIGSVNISENGGSLVVPPLSLTGHILPDANASYDLGSAEYKIRHLFLSDNTLYHQGSFLKVAQWDQGEVNANSASFLITLSKLKEALNASADYDAFKTAILAIADA